MIGAVETLREREVLLDNRRPQGDRGYRGEDVRGVIRQTVRDAETLAHRDHRPEVHLLRGSGVGGRALEDDDLGLCEQRERTLYVVEPCHAGREEDRLSRRSHRLEERWVRHLA